MAQAQVEGGRKKGRSPAYPAVDLETAIERARVLREKEGRNFAHIGAILKHWGYSPKSSSGLVTLSALKKFGLLEDQGSADKRQARTTPLALKILLDDRPDPAERMAAIQEAALKPSIHAELWNAMDGSLPSDANLRYQLRVQRGFTDSAVDEFVDQFRRTMSFARLAATDTISELDDDTSTQDGMRMAQRRVGIAAEDRLAPTRESRGRALQLPLSATTWATLEAPFPLTEDAWEQMIALLNAMKPGLVVPREDAVSVRELPKAEPPATSSVTPGSMHSLSLTAEARELLTSVENGGVPLFATDNLARIARENGVSVSPDMTPNQIIEQLRQRA